jgi:putative transposase
VKFAWIAAEKASFHVSELCRALDVSPSGYYAWCGRPESVHAKRDRHLKVLVRASFEASKHRYGSPRIHEDLLEQHERVSRKRVVRLMQEDGLKARARKRFKCSTMSDHDQPVAANLLARQFTATAPNRRWVGDTTEFVIGESGKLYLAAILDLFSRFVVGWAVSAVNDRHLALKALGMALKRRCPDAGLLHHSDQGCTYASEDYQRTLDAHGITCSMSRRGNCYDNAVMEAFFSSVKSEVSDRFASCGEAKMELFDYIEVFYNQQRRHSTLGQISPAAFERRANEEGVDPMENRPERGFPQAPHPSSFSMKEEETTENDQHNETVH